MDSTVDSLDPTESFSERYGFDCFSIDSITRREIGKGIGANIWRDVKSLLELLAGSEERVIEMLKAMYPQLEEGCSDSESEGETSCESNDSESEENDESNVYKTVLIDIISKFPKHFQHPDKKNLSSYQVYMVCKSTFSL